MGGDREAGKVRDPSWRRSGVSWALADRRSMIVEGGERLRDQAGKLVPVLGSRMAAEGSEEGTLQGQLVHLQGLLKLGGTVCGQTPWAWEAGDGVTGKSWRLGEGCF